MILKHPVLAAGIAALLLQGGCSTSSPPRADSMTATPTTTMQATTQVPPVAAVRPHEVAAPAGTRTDDYYWLRDDDRTNREMLDYLNAENAYTDALLAPVAGLREKVYGEILARIKQDDSSVPYRRHGWWYYSRFETGAEYPVYARREGSMQAAEQVMLDVPALAKGHDFFSIGALEVSPDSRLLAYAEDAVGRRQYTLRFKDLATGAMLPDVIVNAEPEVAWAADNRTLLYVEKHPETLLGYRVRKHVLGTDPKSDVLIYEQDDESFYTTVGKTKDERYLLINASSTVSGEVRYADAADPKLLFHVLLPRERDHEYQADHVEDRWIIRTNWQAKNFRIVEARNGDEGDRSRWRDVIPHRDDAFVHGFDLFRNFLAVEERSGGLRKLRIRPWSGGPEFLIAADEPAYTAELGTNEELDTDVVRYTYTSLTTPFTTYDYDVRTGQRTLLKREPVLGDFDPSHYVTEFVWAPVRDGERVPVSLVYRKGTKLDGTAPLLQYGYGAYGISMDPEFSITRLPLLDRGFVYAIAHIRGGQELGRRWYDDGRLLHKKNTFTDFIDVTRFLVKQRYADPRRVFAYGGSAGGLLMGAVANMAPQDYRGIVSQVPFVDLVTTMLDESIPLTTGEFDEWGNPKDKQYYDYMLSYSPYDQVSRQAYPAMFVGTGLWDSQVQYYEPAKWVAKLRRLKTDMNPLVFRINMEAGHGGKSGRFRHYHEVAEQYAFVLDQAGIRD